MEYTFIIYSLKLPKSIYKGRKTSKLLSSAQVKKKKGATLYTKFCQDEKTQYICPKDGISARFSKIFPFMENIFLKALETQSTRSKEL